MSKKVDAVVIGAGPAGSIVGAYLAKGGLKTAVFEGTGVVGGEKFGSYQTGEFHDDLCSHLPFFSMGSNGGGGWWANAATEVGATIRWQCLPNTAIYNMGADGKVDTIPYCSNGEAFVQFLRDMIPMPLEESTEQALAKVYDEALAIPEDELWWDDSSVMTPFGKWVDKIIDDEAAKQFLAVIAGVLLVFPAEFAFEKGSVQAMAGAFMQHMAGGRSNIILPVGGTCDSIPKAFCDVTTKHGGEVLTNQKVTRIIVEDGKAKGVVVRDADGKEETYEAEYVVVTSNYTTYKTLLGESLPGEITEITKHFSAAHNTSIEIHFALNREVAHPWWSQLIVLTEDFDYGCSIVVPSFFDPGYWAPKGKQLIHAVDFRPTAEYKERTKEEWIQKLTDLVENIYPGFQDAIESTHVREIVPSVHFQYMPVRKIPIDCPEISGLYFAGDGTHAPSFGTERAASSAMMAAKKIL